MEDNYEHVDNRVVYVPTNIPGKGCQNDLFEIEPCDPCQCSDEGKSCRDITSNCACILASGKSPSYDDSGRLINKFGPIVECRSSCLCGESSCLNRIVQRGPNQNLEIRLTIDGKGFGVFCNKSISIGEFVCEYAGEIIGEQEAESRSREDQKAKRDNYIYWIREKYGEENVTQTIVDPTALGNIGRYLNHSCDPNLLACPVRVDCLVPRIALFATKDIEAGSELTFDYGSDTSNSYSESESATNLQFKTCLCRSKNCKGKLPFHCFSEM
jgi:histone-lysine N-methyltransferase SETMAR